MSAHHVTIGRLSATTLTTQAAQDPARIGRLLDGVATRRLDAALRSVPLVDGTWCLRRLDVPVRLDLAAPDPAVEQAWAYALARAVADAIRMPGTAVRYRSQREALADLVAGIAVGRVERAWAWRQVGLLGLGDPDPAAAGRDAALAALGRRPWDAVAAVVLAAERAGLPALHRVLGSTGWARLATLVLAAAGARARVGLDAEVEGRGAALMPSSGSIPVEPAAHTPRRVTGVDGEEVAPTVAGAIMPPAAMDAAQRTASLTSSPAEPADMPGDPDPAALLAQRLVASSRLAAAIARSRLRPDDVTLARWALLVAAEADPTVLRRASAAAVLCQIAGILADPAADFTAAHLSLPIPVPPATRPPAAPAAQTAATPGTEPAPRAVTVRPGEPGDADRERIPGRPPPVPGGNDTTDRDDPCLATSWAGLLFLLATAEAAGVPNEVLEESALAARSLPWVLHGVATALGVPADDPVASVFAGLDPARPLPWPREATSAERNAVDALATRWCLVTLAALHREPPPGNPREVVHDVLRRSATIDVAPGWVEVRMPLRDVDIEIRRAGLDLDPGWVPWLGTVVRFVYE